MELYSEGKNYKLYQGNMLDMLDVVEENSIDSIVTDPPYELNFMNKGWDNAGISFKKETWEKCYKALKPGGHLLAFGGTRTYHRIACAIEDAGFEIRDCIMWLYGSGFPKSMNIGLSIDKKNGVESPVVGQNQDILKKQAKDLREGHRTIVDSLDSGAPERNNGFKTVSADIKQAQNEWNGWGTQLKPSYEPIIIARKPVEGSITENVMKWGVGGYNIDECRVPLEDGYEFKTTNRKSRTDDNVFDNSNCGFDSENNTNASADPKGRFPANTILTYDDTDFDEVCGGFPNTKGEIGRIGRKNGGNYNASSYKVGIVTDYGFKDSGSASRYFYCAKASKKDRDEGLDNLESKARFQQGNYSQSPMCSVCGKTFNGTNNHSLCGEHTMIYVSKEENKVRKNIHPTVKPTSLMQYLVKLVTPRNGIVLDPFNGSGSTGKAVLYENKERDVNYSYIGIELTPEYLPISKARLDFVNKTV
jgi:site-specific DNA-methyltransferase (adenine-specific)